MDSRKIEAAGVGGLVTIPTVAVGPSARVDEVCFGSRRTAWVKADLLIHRDDKVEEGHCRLVWLSRRRRPSRRQKV